MSLKQFGVQIVLSIAALYAAIKLVGSVHIDGLTAVVLLLLCAQILQWISRPFFAIITRVFGILGVLAVSLFGFAVVVWIAIGIVPGVSNDTFWGGFWTAWVYAILMTIVNWVLVSQSDDIYFAQILRTTKKNGANHTDQTGIVFVQLDGVSAPVLEWQLKAGNLPNISKLIRDEGYKFNSWHTQLPSTTPASQAGILLGSNDNIPAFRWYEKDRGELVVANQFKGAALIEKRLSSGKGLLVNGGVSVGNLFSGDAPHNIMVMSKMSKGSGSSLRRVGDYTNYFSSSFGFMRSLILSIGEMVKEIYQARRQVSQNMEPRIKRHGSYILLRAATNVLLRDLQTNVVIQNMMQGMNSIYVDYLDYDEVAHHAGLARAESLASLNGLDKVVGLLSNAREYAARPYEIVLVSDHGQSQGPTFKQLHGGKTLQDFVAEYMAAGTTIQDETAPVEQQSAARSLLTHESSNSAIARQAQKSFDKSVAQQTIDQPEVVITGSGNLGNIWLTKLTGRATADDIETAYPELIEKLLGTEGIGLLLVQTSDGPICVSKKGSINLKTNEIEGHNPLEKYSQLDRASLQRVTSMNTAPDIALISSYDTNTGEVYAFEELVGNHGGLGGWQTEALLLHPKHFTVPKQYLTDGKIYGAPTVHKIFKQWLAQIGQ